MKKIILSLFLLFITALPCFADSATEKKLMDLPLSLGPSQWQRLNDITYIKGQFSKLHAVDIKYDEASLTDSDKKMIAHLLEAADVMDQLFFLQVYAKNPELLKNLESSSDPIDKLKLKYFLFQAGPFDRINEMHNFLNHDKRPLGANFYPMDLTKTEFENWIKNHPGDEKAFRSEFTIIKRDGEKLIAVPYNREYRQLLRKAGDSLKKASCFAENETLKRYLLSRAEAFSTDDYYQSDVDWMTIENSNIELIIGPYEVYEDNLLNYKAAYEAFIYQTIPKDAEEFSAFVKYLPELENNLPIPDADKNMDRDFTSPIRIVNLIRSAGDSKAGIHTSAFALPNDERVRKEKGSKKVMLKNVMSAKFNASTYPIGKKIITPDQVKYIKFESYFRDVVFHEMAHGLGPGELKMADGTKKDVRICLGDLYSSIEECKADTLAMYNQFYLMDKGIISKDDYENMCVSYLTGIFRSVRFGVGEAHGMGALIQLNWMIEKGAFNYNKASGTYSVDFAKFREANKGLSKALLDIQRKGNYNDAKVFIEKYGQVPEHLTITLEKLYDIPIDIYPTFQK